MFRNMAETALAGLSEIKSVIAMDEYDIIPAHNNTKTSLGKGDVNKNFHDLNLNNDANISGTVNTQKLIVKTDSSLSDTDIDGFVNINISSDKMTKIATGTGGLILGNMTGGVIIDSDLTINGKLSFTNVLKLNNGLNVNGETNIVGKISVSGNSTFSGKITCNSGVKINAGGATILGETNINTSGNGITTIGTNGNGRVLIGNSSGIYANGSINSDTKCGYLYTNMESNDTNSLTGTCNGKVGTVRFTNQTVQSNNVTTFVINNNYAGSNGIVQMSVNSNVQNSMCIIQNVQWNKGGNISIQVTNTGTVDNTSTFIFTFMSFN